MATTPIKAIRKACLQCMNNAYKSVRSASKKIAHCGGIGWANDQSPRRNIKMLIKKIEKNTKEKITINMGSTRDTGLLTKGLH